LRWTSHQHCGDSNKHGQDKRCFDARFHFGNLRFLNTQ
jgi:hypothetical protein